MVAKYRGCSLQAKGYSVLTVLERIFARSIPEPNSGCWLWEGAVTNGGYGKVRVGSVRDGSRRTVQVHRVICETLYGLSDDQDCCHRCDNPCCVNPGHLFPGSRRENMQDAKRKDRLKKSALSPAQLAAIRLDDRPHVLIAADYGISRAHVGNIRRGQRCPESK